MKDLNRIVESLGSSGLLSGLAGGLAGGALTGALASKKGRKLGRTALKVGALAAVSGLAWKAYQSYSNRNAIAPAPGPGSARADDLTEDRFAAVAADTDDNPGTMLLLRAMISAAHADGHIDAEERQRIFDRVAEIPLDGADKALLFDELREPLSMDALVTEVHNHETAIEVYVSSALAIDLRQPSSQGYLRRLAVRLGLPRGIVEAVHEEAGLGAPGERSPSLDSAA